MRTSFFRLFVWSILSLICMGALFAQSVDTARWEVSKRQPSRKGTMYVFWGWNRGWYSDADIRFTGDSYDFMLKNVKAFDRQTDWDANIYLNPANMTLPETNFRLGYFLTDRYEISFGVDHMKYVMANNEPTTMQGYIQNTKTGYDGVYNNKVVPLAEDFLTFEHTDGLNYLNIELRRHDNLYTFNKRSALLWKRVNIDFVSGIGAGVMLPKTNTKLLDQKRYDEFHVAGYGLAAVVGLKLTFLSYLFIQTELKGGYINMFDIRTTEHSSDKASEHFFFLQHNYSLGVQYPLFVGKKK